MLECKMITIERPVYLNKLVSKMDNGMIKVITGIRRCGKSFLLFELFNAISSLGINLSISKAIKAPHIKKNNERIII